MAAEGSAGDARPLYSVLGLPADASQEDVRRAYRRLALELHPDRRGAAEAAAAAEAFARLALAYEVLGQPQRRKRYDLTGELPQGDAALGRGAQDTFLAEYVSQAPKAPRGVAQADMSLHCLENYEILQVDSRDVPEYMRGIVMIGLGYLATAVDDMEDKEVVLLRHYVMDQMYALMAYTPPLDASALAERGYIITYYDSPLQKGIQPAWSDQNGLDKGGGTVRGTARAELRSIDEATAERRRLVALEWLGPSPAEAGAAVSNEAACEVPGEGHGPERLLLGARALVRSEPDLGSFGIRRLRQELERVLGLEAGGLDAVGSSALMAVVFQAVEEAEEEEEEDVPRGPGAAEGFPGEQAPTAEAPPAPTAAAGALQAAAGARARVRDTGRVGEVAVHDPEDADLTFKLRFADGRTPAEDWFSGRAVELLMAG